MIPAADIHQVPQIHRLAERRRPHNHISDIGLRAELAGRINDDVLDPASSVPPGSVIFRAFSIPSIRGMLNARNITLPGGTLEAGSKNIIIGPSGEFSTQADIGNVIVGTSSFGEPVYLRDLVDISSGYQSPARYLNFYTWRDAQGHWQRTRAVTLAVQMREGEQIAQFARDVQAKLAVTNRLLPSDLIIASTSDQPRQVKENIDLFMEALYEAIALVVIVSLIGFWEWRSAVLMAISIPITLAMTFAFAHVLGVELQQVSIATLIIALGLLVDDPVVAEIRSTLLGRIPSSGSGRVAVSDEAGARDSIRYDHQHRGVRSVSAVERHDRRISAQLADRDDLRAGGFAAGLHDVHSPAWLLPAAADCQEGEVDGGAPLARVQRLLLSRGKGCDRASLESFRGVVDISGGGRIFWTPAEDAIFPGGRAIPFVPGYMDAE